MQTHTHTCAACFSTLKNHDSNDTSVVLGELITFSNLTFAVALEGFLFAFVYAVVLDESVIFTDEWLTSSLIIVTSLSCTHNRAQPYNCCVVTTSMGLRSY